MPKKTCINHEEFKIDYQQMTTPQLVAKYGVSRRQIQRVSKSLGLKRDQKWINQKAREFQKPHKAASRPLAQSAPLGTIRKRNNGSGIIYLQIKTENGWELLHRYNWLKAGNPLGQKERLIFIDGNTRNCDLSNLRRKQEYVRRDPLWGQRAAIKRQEAKKRAELRKAEREAARKLKAEKEALKRLEQKAAKEKRMQELQQKASESYQLVLKAKAERKAQRQKEAEQCKAIRREKKKAAQVEKQWEQNKRFNARLSEAKKYQTKPVDDTAPKVFVKQIRAWIYLKPGQSADDVIRKYQKTAA